METLNDKIQSVDELLNTPYILEGEFVSRGQVNSDWKVIPSIMRCCSSKDTAEALEIALLRPLFEGGVPYLNSYDPIEYLTILQHYGIPTKLLDVTLNPLKALFFACYDERHEHIDNDGKLIIMPKSFFPPLQMNDHTLKSFKHSSILNTTNPIKRSVFMKRLLNINEIKYFEPINKNPRLEAQEGSFLCFSYLPLKEENSEFVSLEDYMGARNKYFKESRSNINSDEFDICYLYRLVDKNYKQTILNELKDKHGISEDTMFVTAKGSRQVKRYFEYHYEQAKFKAQGLIRSNVK